MVLDLLTKHNKSISGISKERLYEELLQYKNRLNHLNQELAFVKSDNNKKAIELNKKDKLLEELYSEAEGNPLSSGPSKVKDMHLIVSMKAQFKETKKELKEKTYEIEQLKRHIKYTRFQEMSAEISTLTEEMSKLKSFYSVSLQQNQANESKLKEYNLLKKNVIQQADIISQQQELIKKSELELKDRDLELRNLRQMVFEFESNQKRIKREMSNLKEINNRLLKGRDDNSIIHNLKADYEKKMNQLKKEIGFQVSRQSEKEKEIAREKERNKELMDKLSQNRVQPNFESIKDIKSISDNKESNQEIIITLLKTKLNEQIRDSNKFKAYILQLEDKLISLGETITGLSMRDNQLLATHNSKEYSNDIKASQTQTAQFKDNNQSSNTFGNRKMDLNDNQALKSFKEINYDELTYIFIKNFEAFGLIASSAQDTILKSTNGIKDASVMEKIISENIVKHLKLVDKEDIKKVSMLITHFLDQRGWTCEGLIDSLSQLFENVKAYTEVEKVNLNKKLKKHLKPLFQVFMKMINKEDEDGKITFHRLREILNESGLVLKDKYTEYLIYFMKSSIKSQNKLYYLDVTRLEDLILKTLDDSQLNSSIEKNEDQMLEEELETRIKKILLEVNDYLTKLSKPGKNLSIIDVFKSDSFRPQSEEGVELDVCIDLNSFIEFLRNTVKCSPETNDEYCIFKKYNLDEEYEVISLERIDFDIRRISAERLLIKKNSNKVLLNVIQENDVDEERYDSGKKRQGKLIYE